MKKEITTARIAVIVDGTFVRMIPISAIALFVFLVYEPIRPYGMQLIITFTVIAFVWTLLTQSV